LFVVCFVAPSSPIIVTLMMEATHCSETSVNTSAIRRNIPEDGIFGFVAMITTTLAIQAAYSSETLTHTFNFATERTMA
jgi:hypothetical protein